MLLITCYINYEYLPAHFTFRYERKDFQRYFYLTPLVCGLWYIRGRAKQVHASVIVTDAFSRGCVNAA